MERVELVYFDPAEFPDREAVRAFVRSETFRAYAEAAREALIGTDAHQDLATAAGERALREAREALFFVLSDLRELVCLAVGPGPFPGLSASAEVAEERPRRLAAIVRVIASSAADGAPIGPRAPILDALYASLSHGKR